MAKKHGARQQKKIAKQKARRAEKRSELAQRTSNDPAIRLRRADKWPVVRAVVGARLWEDGIGSLAIARQEAEGRLVFGVYLVDVYCLGVKNAFWRAGSPGDFEDLISDMEQAETMRPISPACLVKIVKGAVEYARLFDFPPHPDYRHAAMLLEGIDPSTCPQEFTFGRDGRPFYMQGPNESYAEVTAIVQRVQEAGGHFILAPSGTGLEDFDEIEDGFDDDFGDEDDASHESH
jgi:hypothetical protein